MRDQDHDEEPELAGYEPHERPLRSPHLRTAMRVAVVLGLAGLILPGILVTAATAARTASAACSVYTKYYAPDSVGYSARFDLVSPGGPGWNCYAEQYGGDELLLRPLGIIPGAVTIVPTEQS